MQRPNDTPRRYTVTDWIGGILFWVMPMVLVYWLTGVAYDLLTANFR